MKGIIAKILDRLKGDNKGSLNPSRLDNITPLTARREAELRGVYYDCKNIRDLLNELDRRDAIIQQQDRDIWRMVNKNGKP